MAQPINYAESYSRALAQAYPYVLNFGALYATPNNGRYRMGEDGKTIYIPRIDTTGRVDSNRDSIATAARNYDNSWEPKTLTRHRMWSTLVHPKDVDQTNMVASISNITRVFNEEHKFPEMDAYLISTLYSLWTDTDAKDAGKKAMTADTTELTEANILEVFDKLMVNMDEARVPANGRILYVTSSVRKILNAAEGIFRTINVTGSASSVNRQTSRLDEVQIVSVPSSLMKTKYEFTTDWKAAEDAKQINMFLVHPSAVITPVSYEFSTLDSPSALTGGKYFYYEESDEDVFILNRKADALQFNVAAGE